MTAPRGSASSERLHDGDLHDWVRGLDQLRHGVQAKMLVPVPWSPLQSVDLDSVPTSGQHPLTLFMEDTAWPHEGMLDEYLEAARTHYAPSLAEGRHGRSMLDLQAVLRPAWGSAGWRRGRAVAEGRRPAPHHDADHDRGAARVQGSGHLDARRAARA